MQATPAIEEGCASAHPERSSENGNRAGRLIINADDWGKDALTTDAIHQCVLRRTVSSVSAMVFMADSERAFAIAREKGVDAGLHLNFTTPFTASNVPAKLADTQRKIGRRLLSGRLAQAWFDPLLCGAFKEVVSAQIEEFSLRYGHQPERIDGHHHMHLCANVIWGKLLPRGIAVRRNFSFEPGEKSFANRWYRRVMDSLLARRHRLTDYFFSIAPLSPRKRLERIFNLARRFTVEVETHPADPEEYKFLTSGEILRWTNNLRIASRFVI